MGYYVIVRGPLGCGKSTIARALARILKAEYVSFDRVLEENGLDRADNNFVPEDFIKADNIVLSKARKDLGDGKVVIFDGCFYFKEHVQHLMDNLPFEGFVFSLKASLETCVFRDSKRSRVYGEKAVREVYELLNKYVYGISIDTDNKTEEEVIMKIFSYLP